MVSEGKANVHTDAYNTTGYIQYTKMYINASWKTVTCIQFLHIESTLTQAYAMAIKYSRST